MQPTILVPAVLAALLHPALSQAEAASRAEAAPRVIEGFASPESVLIDGDHRYVSNIGPALAPLAKDGDGFISDLGPDGTVMTLHAFPGDGTTLDAPKGMAMAGGRLYVTDIDRIVGFDPATRARVFEAPLPEGGPVFANDLAAVDATTLLVSDTGRNALYRLDLPSRRWTLLTDAIPGANGILHDPASGETLVVGLGANFSGGDLFTVGATGETRRVPGGPHGLLDGIARRSDGSLLVSDWIAFDHPVSGQLVTLAPNGTEGTPLPTDIPLVGPADFTIDADGALWVPALPANAVVILPPAAPK